MFKQVRQDADKINLPLLKPEPNPLGLFAWRPVGGDSNIGGHMDSIVSQAELIIAKEALRLDIEFDRAMLDIHQKVVRKEMEMILKIKQRIADAEKLL
jgi:hypothetical protein